MHQTQRRPLNRTPEAPQATFPSTAVLAVPRSITDRTEVQYSSTCTCTPLTPSFPIALPVRAVADPPLSESLSSPAVALQYSSLPCSLCQLSLDPTDLATRITTVFFQSHRLNQPIPRGFLELGARLRSRCPVRDQHPSSSRDLTEGFVQWGSHLGHMNYSPAVRHRPRFLTPSRPRKE